jgi:predicted RNase H-like HicB family nuclease
MTEYLAIYERNKDGWWAYVPDLPGCTAAGDSREEVERNAHEAVAAHVELLRSTGRAVPEPSTYDVSRIAV